MGDNRDLEFELSKNLRDGDSVSAQRAPKKLHKKFKQQTIYKFKSNYFELEKSVILVK